MATLEQTDLRLEGMSCSACVATIERSLNSIEGVSATVNFATETAHILAPTHVTEKELISTVKKAGYGATLLSDESESFSRTKRMGWRVIIAALFATPVIVMSMVMSFHHWVDDQTLTLLDRYALPLPLYSAAGWVAIGLTAPIIFIIAWPIHRAAIRNIAHPTMDTLVSLGSLSAYGWSIYANATGAGDLYTEVAAGVLFFIVLGRYFESKAKKRAGSALSHLLSLNPKEVAIVRGSETVIAPIESLEIGDHCVVKPGERFPTDGIVIEGKSSVDNSLLTGESLPLDIAPGSTVISGAINLNGRVIIRAERIGKDTELSRITQMVLTAQTEKAPLQQLADRISSYFVPVVLVIAAGTFALWYFSGYSLQRSIATAVAVLVIACPCALGLATPVAFLVATGRGAQRGIVLRKTSSLEIASTINTVVFDKTGTLTQGEMKVIDFTFVENRALAVNLTELRSAINTIESESTHPIAKAITRYLIAHESGSLPATDFDSTTGAGVAARVRINGKELPVIIGSPDSVLRATLAFPPDISNAIARAHSRGNTISVVAVDGIALAAIEVGDTMKPDARDAVSALHAAGIETWLITGDHAGAAHELADAVGIPRERTISDARPENKVELIKKLQSEKSSHISQHKHIAPQKKNETNKRVLMIGDGINDAAALVAADLSMAMGTGTDTAISSADITLMRPTLYAALDALKLSTKTLRTIKGNLLWAFLYNAIGIPIAALGLLDPMYAGAAMAGSSLFVVLNSLRISVR